MDILEDALRIGGRQLVENWLPKGWDRLAMGECTPPDYMLTLLMHFRVPR